MQQHLCSCMIDIANEGHTVVNRDADNPVPWPEILVLQSIHGDQSVFDIEPKDNSTSAPRGEQQKKNRMMSIYGRDAVEAVYAGKGFDGVVHARVAHRPGEGVEAPAEDAGARPARRQTRTGRRSVGRPDLT